MHFPAHFVKWNGPGGCKRPLSRSNVVDLEKRSGVDLVASAMEKEQSSRLDIMKGLVQVKDRLTCTISRALPSMSPFLSKDASCPYIDKKTGTKKGETSSSSDVKVANENELKQSSGKRREV